MEIAEQEQVLLTYQRRQGSWAMPAAINGRHPTLQQAAEATQVPAKMQAAGRANRQHTSTASSMCQATYAGPSSGQGCWGVGCQGHARAMRVAVDPQQWGMAALHERGLAHQGGLHEQELCSEAPPLPCATPAWRRSHVPSPFVGRHDMAWHNMARHSMAWHGISTPYT